MKIGKKLSAALLAFCVVLAGCGGTAGTASGSGEVKKDVDTASVSESLAVSEQAGETVAGTAAASEDSGQAPEIAGLTYDHQMPLDYAECFDVYYYQDGYKLIDVHDSAQYLIVPEGKSAPDGLSEEITVLQQPLDHIYLAATSAMALFDVIDSIDSVTLTGTDVNGWYIDAPKEALASGSMQFAGKYSEPDYEMLVDDGCDLAIESTMILHAPEVQEMLEDLDIPVFIDRSSYESQALGRTEWVRAYAAMMNQEDAANTFFEKEEKAAGGAEGYEATGKTVAFFSINSDGSVVIRSKNDYIPTMIRQGGGTYIFDDDGAVNTEKASVEISMEDFYSTAVNADYLIYNASIEESLDSLDDLIEKESLMADFKAVKDGNVWQVGKEMYQATDRVSEFVTDVHLMLTGGDAAKMTFMKKIS